MLALNLPKFEAKVVEKDKKYLIFDSLRHKYVPLTPEEWVRQHFIAFLLTEKGYPAGLVGNEIHIKVNGTNKRCDTVVYNSFLEPLVIIEYKAPQISISQQTFDQIVRYNMTLKVNYLIVTNGLRHYCCRIDYNNRSYSFLKDIPGYDQLI